MDFNILKTAFAENFDKLKKYPMFRVNVSKDTIWDAYLNSFPEGTNPIYKERTEHDCQCCRQFIRTVGNVVAIIDGEQVSVWDFLVNDDAYQFVIDELTHITAEAGIVAPFYHYEKIAGTNVSRQLLDNGDIQEWSHFHVKLGTRHVRRNKDIPTIVGNARSEFLTTQRAFKELTQDAVNTVLDLIDQGSLYRGDEYVKQVKDFNKAKVEYDELPHDYQKDLFIWEAISTNMHYVPAHIRNSAIGTLLIDLSADMNLEVAVGRFESVVAPANYKRSSALITQKMIDAAQNKIKDMGAQDSLSRRYAVASDVSINNVLFADRAVRKVMPDAFDMLTPTKSVVHQKLDTVAEISIEDFITKVIPNIDTMELMVENNHTSNLMSLIAPVYPTAPNILKWDNNFTWTYNNDVTDSMKQRVKTAGGKVDGVLRFSIQWNDINKSNSDLDAHCAGPVGERIYFGSPTGKLTGGKLDVDIQNPEPNTPAVENITWATLDQLLPGNYVFKVHNYSKRSGRDSFTAEVEYDGIISEYSYPQDLIANKTITVCAVHVGDDKKMSITHELSNTPITKQVWGVGTGHYHKVNMLMLSPNYWDGFNKGNKHYFFMLDKCLQPNTARGFYNEFLSNDLHDDRKVFEVLGSKMKVPASDDQLSGLGFSSTQRNHVYCKVSGSFTRSLKITF